MSENPEVRQRLVALHQNWTALYYQVCQNTEERRRLLQEQVSRGTMPIHCVQDYVASWNTTVQNDLERSMEALADEEKLYVLISDITYYETNCLAAPECIAQSAGPACDLQIVVWNTCGCVTREGVIKEAARRMDCDVVCLLDTKCSIHLGREYESFNHRVVKSSNTGGISVSARTRGNATLRLVGRCEPSASEILWLAVEHVGRLYAMATVHNRDSSSKYFDAKFFDKLKHQTRMIECFCPDVEVLIFGHFNVRIGDRPGAPPVFVWGRESRDTHLGRGREKLCDFCEQLDYVVLNGRTPGDPSGEYTTRSRGEHGRSVADYALVQSRRYDAGGRYDLEITRPAPTLAANSPVNRDRVLRVTVLRRNNPRDETIPQQPAAEVAGNVTEAIGFLAVDVSDTSDTDITNRATNGEGGTDGSGTQSETGSSSSDEEPRTDVQRSGSGETIFDPEMKHILNAEVRSSSRNESHTDVRPSGSGETEIDSEMDHDVNEETGTNSDNESLMDVEGANGNRASDSETDEKRSSLDDEPNTKSGSGQRIIDSEMDDDINEESGSNSDTESHMDLDAANRGRATDFNMDEGVSCEPHTDVQPSGSRQRIIDPDMKHIVKEEVRSSPRNESHMDADGANAGRATVSKMIETGSSSRKYSHAVRDTANGANDSETCSDNETQMDVDGANDSEMEHKVNEKTSTNSDNESHTDVDTANAGRAIDLDTIETGPSPDNDSDTDELYLCLNEKRRTLLNIEMKEDVNEENAVADYGVAGAVEKMAEEIYISSDDDTADTYRNHTIQAGASTISDSVLRKNKNENVVKERPVIVLNDDSDMHRNDDRHMMTKKGTSNRSDNVLEKNKNKNMDRNVVKERPVIVLNDDSDMHRNNDKTIINSDRKLMMKKGKSNRSDNVLNTDKGIGRNVVKERSVIVLDDDSDMNRNDERKMMIKKGTSNRSDNDFNRNKNNDIGRNVVKEGPAIVLDDDSDMHRNDIDRNVVNIDEQNEVITIADDESDEIWMWNIE